MCNPEIFLAAKRGYAGWVHMRQYQSSPLLPVAVLEVATAAAEAAIGAVAAAVTVAAAEAAAVEAAAGAVGWWQQLGRRREQWGSFQCNGNGNSSSV
jgi:hypothetical protein